MDSKMIETIREYFKTQPVLKAWIFGSYARGEETPESDVDILVELDLQSLLQKSIDLVSSRGMSKYIKPYVDSEKLLLYEC